MSVALGKFWITKRTPHFVYECLECLGGGGYVEEGPLARYYREAPLNAIWEGSGNVIALDILRTFQKDPAALAAYFAEVDSVRGANKALDNAAAELRSSLADKTCSDSNGRRIAERLALVLQAALLARYAPPFIADAYCASRLGSEWSANFGAAIANGDVDAIVSRQSGPLEIE